MVTVHRSPYPAPDVPAMDLAAFVLERAPSFGDAAALVGPDGGEMVTYAELPARVHRAAARLVAAGVGPGDVVALASPNRPAWAVAFYAVMAAGAVVTPVNPALTAGEVRSQLASAHTRWAVADPAVAATVDEAGAPLGVPVLDVGDLTAAGTRAGAGAGVPAVVDPEATAVLPFSSGTTGSAKGVMLSHRNLVANLVQHEPVYDVVAGDVVAAALPLFHIYGMTIILGYALRHGATVVTLPRFSLDAYLDVIVRHRVTWLHLAPPMVLALVDPAAAGADLSSVRRAVSGAAPLEAPLAMRGRARIGCAIGQGYGMTEASPGVTYVPSGDPDSCPPGSVGYLVPGTEGRVVDPATGDDTAGEGELWVRGPQVTAGYLHNPAATAATLVDGGWLRTGDIVRVDPAGAWFVTDRLKELIKYKGYQVAPAELESALLEHPDVADAAVVGVPDPVAGEIPMAFLVPAAGARLDPDQVQRWLAGRVAPYKKVRAVQVVDAIPKSPSGKILRRLLRG